MSAHPRVGGEHIASIVGASLSSGSSPRGRGTHVLDAIGGLWWRLIPAWAGNTAPRSLRQAVAAAHPRVGGEHPDKIKGKLSISGSSPRGRGTRTSSSRRRSPRRLIPAWAGNTIASGSGSISISAHPRVGGEHCASIIAAGGRCGSSPRGRGTLLVPGRCRARRRLIPAWAGNTRTRRDRRAVVAAHPRVGGEHPRCDARDGHGLRLIPAWAGNTDGCAPRIGLSSAHPRVGGEHCEKRTRRSSGDGSAPRGRGTRRTQSTRRRCCRLIPAWAGNTPLAPD